MSKLTISGPGAEPEKNGPEQAHGDGHHTGADRQRQQRKHAKKTKIPSEEDCLRAIAHVARLAALGVLKPSVANTVRSSFRDILQYHKAKAKEDEKNLSNSDVLELLKNDPRLLSLLEPLLSQEQVEMIMKNVDGDPNKGA